MGEGFGNIVLLLCFSLSIFIYILTYSMSLLIVYSAKLLGKWESVCVCKLTLKIFILKYLLNRHDNYTDT